MLVTTSCRPAPALLAQAQAWSARWKVPFVTRGGKDGLDGLLATQSDAVLVFEASGATLWDREGRLKWSPGMAALRLERMGQGATDDRFLRVAELKPGESVLDCTLGLAQDALVAARAVGPAGKVVGCEVSLPLFAVVSLGLAAYAPGAASCPIEVVFGDGHEFLRAQPDRSFDCVVFDPMFERTRASSGSFSALRRHASYAPLTPQALAEAGRVARRTVVVKGARYSSDLKKLGLTAVPGSRFNQVSWARLVVA